MKLPIDIERKIDQLFIDLEDKQEVKKIILRLWSTNLNVGEEQLVRSILTISNGNTQKLRDIIKDLYVDPRDVIMTAECLAGNPGHYFIPTFDEIENGK
ncbi:MAG: hypothetical protein WCK02_10400 [Bacteroidota bacterium]